MNTFFIADTHFGEDNIRRYENRPFEHVEQMDEEIIRRWNEIVHVEDEVYVLGDFGAIGKEEMILSKLAGTKYLIKGNHDTYSNEEYRKMGFSECYNHPIIIEGFWILSHEPMYINENMPYVNLFGHVHNSPQYKTYSSQHYCVSVERIGYQPIIFDEIKRKMKEGNSNV